MKFLIRQFSTTSSALINLLSKYSPQRVIKETQRKRTCLTIQGHKISVLFTDQHQLKYGPSTRRERVRHTVCSQPYAREVPCKYIWIPNPSLDRGSMLTLESSNFQRMKQTSTSLTMTYPCSHGRWSKIWIPGYMLRPFSWPLHYHEVKDSLTV
jgi:hypothetical protein